jgi:NAD(P)-dependent dehydrogenase (short-subunit alcohol dehydrogenase family)
MSPVILITGATDGIGRETASGLVRRGASVILHGRNEERLEKAAAEMRKEARGGAVWTVMADFASLRQVRAMAEEVVHRFDRLDVLLNNAGVYMKTRHRTEDGLEMTFAVNHLAHFLLTVSLLGMLKSRAPSRVITVSSIAHTRGQFDPDNLQGEKRFEPYAAYALSKLANILFTYELAERLRGTGVTVNCLHPGVVTTKLLRAGFPASSGIPPSQGAETSVYLAIDPDAGHISGEYFIDSKPHPSSAESHDPSLRRTLWERSRELAGVDDIQQSFVC